MTATPRTDLVTHEDLHRLLDRYSVEVVPRDRRAADACARSLAPGAECYIGAVPGSALDEVVALAVRLDRLGFVPVPHLVARGMPSEPAFRDFLSRLSGEAGVTQALVLGGDIDRPLGPYGSALDLLRTGLIERAGMRRIGLGCYPEGHPKVTDSVLATALADKLGTAAEQGLDPWLVSQFSFDARAIVAFIDRLRSSGVTAPLRVGIAGPAKRATLIRYAMICGIGNSMRALAARPETFGQLVGNDTPDDLLTGLAAAHSERPSRGIAGIHVFTFGGIDLCAQWANGLLGRAARG
jgi:methylenetetrahydrofolate reductase (NADPH)